MSLPERIECSQDIEDVYAHFEHEANHYVLMRLRREDTPGFRGRLFVDGNDPRFITADEVAELKRYLNDGEGDLLWMRAALNAVQDLAQIIGLEKDNLSSIKTKLVVNEHVRCGLSDLTSSMMFYDPVVEAVNLWRRYHNVLAKVFETKPPNWFNEPCDALDGKGPNEFLLKAEDLTRLETLLGIGVSP